MSETREPIRVFQVATGNVGTEMIKRIASQGIAVVIITHIMAQAFQVADRMVVIRQGLVAGDVARDQTSPDQVVQMITGEGIMPSTSAPGPAPAAFR